MPANTNNVSDMRNISALPQPPLYTPNDTELFFLKLELYFEQNKVTDQNKKLMVIVSVINDCSLSATIKSVLNNVANLQTPYNELKQKILAVTTLSQEEKFDIFLKASSLGDMSPSRFLDYLQGLCGSDNENSAIVKAKFLNALSSDTRNILATMPNATLSELAKTADRIHSTRGHAPISINKISDEIVMKSDVTAFFKKELTSLHQILAKQSEEINALKLCIDDRGNLPKNSGDGKTTLCYYHRKFGTNARKCDPSCAKYNGKTTLN